MRRKTVRIARKRARIRPYRIPASARWIVREAQPGPGPLREALAELARLKREGFLKDYAIGGAVGAMRYTEPLTTQDLDIFFIPVTDSLTAGLPEIYAQLRRRGFAPRKAYVVIGGVPVQFLAVDALAREAVEMAGEVDYEGVRTKTCSCEHLVALAVRAGRLKDWARVELLLEQGRVDRAKLNAILGRHGLAKAFAAGRRKFR